MRACRLPGPSRDLERQELDSFSSSSSAGQEKGKGGVEEDVVQGQETGRPGHMLTTAASDTANGEMPERTGQGSLKPWGVVAGSFSLSTGTYGLLSASGLFSTYFADHQLASRSSNDVAWIMSMFGFWSCFLGAPAGILFDRYGPRIILPLACLVYVAAFVGLAFSDSYAQIVTLFTVAGLSAGVSVGCVISLSSPRLRAARHVSETEWKKLC
jgi:Na+/melibiose symporter-like transporter